MRVVLGGTFDPLHKGHKALFNQAFEIGQGGEIIIGLTSDILAKGTRTRKISPFHMRKQSLETYLYAMQKKYPNTRCTIVEITEVLNIPITREVDADALVVSEGRRGVAEETNLHRKLHGKSPMEIFIVPYVLAMDGSPIKATRIANKEIDTEGRILETVKVAVGTNNDVKLRAVKNIFTKVFDRLELVKVSVTSGVPPQPREGKTIIGAQNRATRALKKVPDAHFGVGIEAGLFMDEMTNNLYDVQYCAITDRGDRMTVGHGPGFYYPPKVVDELQKEKTVGEVMSKLTGIDDIGQKMGAIGYLTKDILTREGLSEQAVLMALVPRITELYD